MLTREYILSLPAGRELDELIVEKVMGWEKVDNGRTSEPLYTWYHTKNGVRYDVTAKAWTFNPSRSISAAWEVVEKMSYVKAECVFDLQLRYQGFWATFNCEGKKFESQQQKTAPEAICKSALLAVIGS